MPPTTPPTIRVFLGTTYRDMRAERSYLHAQVFPKIAAWYVRQGITVEFFDPRWMATEDQAEGFELLKTSLDQVGKCKPFFIGLLGERYGRGLTEVRRDVAAAYPWILKAATKGISRLHLEMIHGVLNDPARATGGFFYLRGSVDWKQERSRTRGGSCFPIIPPRVSAGRS